MTARAWGLTIALGLTAAWGARVGAEEIPIDCPAESARRTVSVGVYPLSIHDIDVATQTFKADFYLWIRYTRAAGETCLPYLPTPESLDTIDKTPEQIARIAKIRLIMDTEQIEMMNGREVRTERTTYDLPGQCATWYRVSGTFAQPFDLHRYPYDRQALTIRIENPVYGICDVNYEVMQAKHYGERRNGSRPFKDAGGLVGPPGWTVESGSTSTRLSIYETDWGLPDHPELQYFSQIVVRFDLQRQGLKQLLVLILPLVVFSILTSFVMLLGNEDVQGGLELCAVVLLSVVAHHYAFIGSMPDMAGIRYIDAAFFGTYWFVGSMILFLVLRKSRGTASRPAFLTLACVGPAAALILAGIPLAFG